VHFHVPVDAEHKAEAEARQAASDLRSPRLYQTSVGLERQITTGSRLTVTVVVTYFVT